MTAPAAGHTGKVIVTVAPTGGFLTRVEHRYVPTQPDEIAADVARCADAGASVAALHARRPDGRATCSAAIYRDINARVRAACDVVVNNSTGGGIDGDLLRVRPDGSRVIDWDARMAGVDGGADTCTLDAITAYISGPGGREVLMDTPMERAIELAAAMFKRGIKPEWEAFNPSHLVREVARLTALGFDTEPYQVNLVLGLDGAFQNALPYTPSNLQHMADALPGGSVFTVTVNGEQQFRGLAHALALGGHIRVGIEDNPCLAPGEPAENVRLVERAVALVQSVGLEPATPAEAREILGLPTRKDPSHAA
ncbi:3-keto-5-aminohexanoate cleavage protein [Actinomadura syzygii]|uniref:3-keto-5-aminohexanoate cleavage protein n=1 Tax=Actinomadura syzygii TaxID=1427538 RepID=A0A5D0TTA3_9ACTN|nr:3-keto-5-aminohexanoate cleavage protein [Actinomadura syzygii]TYC08670.1 3-keto-5-aminohexanoate cleavage protein [Actinomadura syzygii]